MGPTVAQRAEFAEKPAEYPFDILADFFVREAKRSIAPVFIDLVATHVAARIMRIAIYFDDQRFLRAVKIGDTIADDVLASKFETAKLGSTEVAPQSRFERAPILAEAPSAVE